MRQVTIVERRRRVSPEIRPVQGISSFLLFASSLGRLLSFLFVPTSMDATGKFVGGAIAAKYYCQGGKFRDLVDAAAAEAQTCAAAGAKRILNGVSSTVAAGCSKATEALGGLWNGAKTGSASAEEASVDQLNSLDSRSLSSFGSSNFRSLTSNVSD